jgi:membrane-associated phospholipid phosphatase
VLPPIGACDVERLEARHYVAGHCYDKVPSGHFVVAATLLLLLHRTRRLGAAAAAALAAAVGAGILLLRWHYSIDVAVGALLVLAVDGAVGPP